MANTNMVTPEFFERLLPEGRACARARCRQPIRIGQRVYRVGFNMVYHVPAECSDPSITDADRAKDPETLGRGISPRDLPADAWGENE